MSCDTKMGLNAAESFTPQSENTLHWQQSGIDSLRELDIMLAKSAVLCIVFIHMLGECKNITINSLSTDPLFDYIHRFSSVLTTTFPIHLNLSSIPYASLTEISLHVEE